MNTGTDYGWISHPVFTSGATDDKTHGSDHFTDFESRIESFFGSAKNKQNKTFFFFFILKA